LTISQAFYAPAHQIVYDVLMAVEDKSKPVDFFAVKQALQDAGQLDEIGGVHALNELWNFVPSAGNAEGYMDEVIDKWKRRYQWLEGRELQKQALDLGKSFFKRLKSLLPQLKEAQRRTECGVVRFLFGISAQQVQPAECF
jgi:replicative DNA helicase